MRILTLDEVGTISFVQSIIMVVSFSQLGLLNGGYRLISKSDTYVRQINNFIFSYNFYLLCGALTLIYPIYFIFNFSFDLIIFTYSILVGFISVVSNWVTNLLIADQKISLLNKTNLISLASSFLCLLLINVSSLWAGILFVTSQSFIIIFIGIYFGGYQIGITHIKKRTFRYILLSGFTPYLINILGGVVLIFEKWIIAYDLGMIDLGSYFIVGVYSTFFYLLPGALNNLEFPTAMRLFNKKSSTFEMLNKYKSYFFKLLIYVIIAGLITYFLAELVLKYLLPKYLIAIPLIKIVYWGLALITLIQPITLILQVQLKYNTILSVYIISLFLVLIGYYFFSFKDYSTLRVYASLNLFFNSIVAVSFCITLWQSIRSEIKTEN
jgi:O-antigen/teichoic acid export membrane protein